MTTGKEGWGSRLGRGRRGWFTGQPGMLYDVAIKAACIENKFNSPFPHSNPSPHPATLFQPALGSHSLYKPWQRPRDMLDAHIPSAFSKSLPHKRYMSSLIRFPMIVLVNVGLQSSEVNHASLTETSFCLSRPSNGYPLR